MSLYEKVKNKKEKIAIIGLGYVGIPLAIAFAEVAEVVGFDISEEKVKRYRAGIDVTKEVGDEIIKRSTALFTWEEKQLRFCKFFIVAVPTPVNSDKTPDLRSIKGAAQLVGRNLTPGSIVVFESTVYPGVTEDICVPLLEKESGLKCGVDFKVGYSPERINPGDHVHRLANIVKVVAGMDEESLAAIAQVYELVVKAGVYKAETIKVAEAAKVIENSQRDINIAFMNELSIIFNKLGIDTKAVLEAAGTKWNFLKFMPGIVGGHCIGVDPYYLTHKAEELGYHSQVILAGRKINDDMGKYIAENTVKKMAQAGKLIKGSRIAVFGITFKENCPDVRNTKVIDIIKELEEYGVEIYVVDPLAGKEDLFHEYALRLTDLKDIQEMDVLIFAVPHEEFKTMSLNSIKGMYRNEPPILIDVKGVFDRKEAVKMGYLYWRL